MIITDSNEHEGDVLVTHAAKTTTKSDKAVTLILGIKWGVDEAWCIMREAEAVC